MRHIPSKEGQVIGKFKFLQCLSASESTAGNANPLYSAACIACGTIRKVHYRNRNASCLKCKALKPTVRRPRGQAPSFGEFNYRMFAANLEAASGRLVFGDLAEDCYQKLSATEAAKCQLWLIDKDGSARLVHREEYEGIAERSFEVIAAELGYKSDPLAEDLEDQEQEEVQEILARPARIIDAPPL